MQVRADLDIRIPRAHVLGERLAHQPPLLGRRHPVAAEQLLLALQRQPGDLPATTRRSNRSSTRRCQRSSAEAAGWASSFSSSGRPRAQLVAQRERVVLRRSEEVDVVASPRACLPGRRLQVAAGPTTWPGMVHGSELQQGHGVTWPRLHRPRSRRCAHPIPGTACYVPDFGRATQDQDVSRKECWSSTSSPRRSRKAFTGKEFAETHRVRAQPTRVEPRQQPLANAHTTTAPSAGFPTRQGRRQRRGQAPRPAIPWRTPSADLLAKTPFEVADQYRDNGGNPNLVARAEQLRRRASMPTSLDRRLIIRRRQVPSGTATHRPSLGEVA